MKYIKTFESFKLNETQDMMFMPVDPIKGAAEVYSDIADALGGKFHEALDKVEEVAEAVVEKIGGKASEVLSSVERFFGIPAEELTYDAIVAKLEKSNESFVDKYDETDPYDGHGETMTTPLKDIKGGPVQKILAILQRVFAINMLSIGLLGTFVAWIAGISVSVAVSFLVAIAAFVIIHIVRKLIAMATA